MKAFPFRPCLALTLFPFLFFQLFSPTCSSADSAVWSEDSFEDFADGTFEDAGANTYVSAAGKVQTVNHWDLNSDGSIDLVFCNTHPLIEALDLSIYWGNGKDFDLHRRSLVPVDGAQWSSAADLDGDGALDLAVANYSNGTWTDMDSFVYYGAGQEAANPSFKEEGWHFHPFNRKLTLPSKGAQYVASGDLNRDGFADLVFAFSAGHWEYRTTRDQEYLSPSRIYWGSEEGFSAERFQDLPAMGASCVSIGDLNGDEWPEVVLANASKSGETDIDSFVYWGGQEGFSSERRTSLPTHQAAAVEMADLNNDKQTDLLFSNEGGQGSYGYLNHEGQFSPERRVEFETFGAKDSAVADFNRDGFTDVFFSNHSREGNRITNSYLYYGGAQGFSSENRISLDTLGAWGASAADLNEDGWVDLFVCNHQEHYSYEVPSFVYWNGESGFEISRRTPLFEHGATGNAIADFDGDGHLDILVHSFAGRSRGDYDDNYVYWGNPEGRYTPDHRLDLPGRDTYEFAAADFNDDSYVDLVFANSGEGGRMANENWVYWNGPNSFNQWALSGLPSFLSLGVQVADLDRDGYIDVVVCNFGVEPRTKHSVSYIYWGSADGFPVLERSEIPHVGRSCAIADLNEDGHLDLVFGAGAKRWAPDQADSAVVFLGDGTRQYGAGNGRYLEGTAGSTQPEVADLDRDGHLDLVFGNSGLTGNARILYGDGKAGVARKAELPAGTSNNVTIADLNSDGWLDLVFPCYKSPGPPVSRSTESSLYYGGPDGFDPGGRFLLPTNSSAGSLVSDYDRDGRPDLLFFNHRQEGDPNRIGAYGDHLTDSYLYWGGAEGFSPDRRDGIPSLGVHNDSGVDIGEIAGRGFEFAYTSSPYQFEGRVPKSLAWKGTTPASTAIRFQLRFAETREELGGSVWVGPQGESSFYETSGEPIVFDSGSWMQYRAVLDTVNGALSPVLDRVEVFLE